MSDVPLYQAPPRPRISIQLALSWREALGKRDFSKGERSSLHEVLTSMLYQCAREGFPTMPLAADDSAELAALKRKHLDGVYQALMTRPELFTEVERELLPRLLEEATHDFRPHAGHARAVPTHVIEAQQARARAAEGTDTSAEGTDTLADVDAKLALQSAMLNGRIDAQDQKLDAILAHLKGLASPAPSPEQAAAASPAPSPEQAAAADDAPSHKRHR